MNKGNQRPSWLGYIVTALIIATAAGLRLWPLQALGQRTVWVTFYPAVMAAALYGGLLPGLLGTALSCGIAVFAWPLFVAKPFIKDPADWLTLAVFVVTCAMISMTVESMRRAQARAKIAREQAEAANKELEAFSYSVSHDLRAPLRSIDGFSQAFLEDFGSTVPEEGREDLERVRRATQHMGQLIDDMLLLSRVTRREMHVQETDMSALAADVAGELARDNPQRDVQLSIEPGMTATGDPQLLRIVLVNLLGNAWKFTSKRQHAHVSMGTVRDLEHGRAFFVRDDGVGFDAKYKDKLFVAFQRLHAQEEFPGTGIGLATIQRAVRRHGGDVWAEGEADRGATFYFTIPDLHVSYFVKGDNHE